MGSWGWIVPTRQIGHCRETGWWERWTAVMPSVRWQIQCQLWFCWGLLQGFAQFRKFELKQRRVWRFWNCDLRVFSLESVYQMNSIQHKFQVLAQRKNLPWLWPKLPLYCGPVKGSTLSCMDAYTLAPCLTQWVLGKHDNAHGLLGCSWQCHMTRLLLEMAQPWRYQIQKHTTAPDSWGLFLSENDI